MIVKKHIFTTLVALDKRYIKSSSDDSVYFAKLAILEYCGWIEESLDDVVHRAARGKLKTQEFKNMLNSLVENTYGFDYKKNFRPLLSRVVGLQGAEVVETKLKHEGVFEVLVSELEAVKELRNNAAHTWIKGTTMTYPAPSLIRARFETVLPIFKSIYSEVSAL